MKKKGLVAGGLGLIATGLVAWLLNKDYKHHLKKFASEEDDTTPKKENLEKDVKEKEEVENNTSIVSKVVNFFYKNITVDDDVLYSYKKAASRRLGSNQIELHMLEDGKVEKYLEVLVRVPENRTYYDFQRNITAAIEDFWEKYKENPLIADRIRKKTFQLLVFTKVGKKEEEKILMDYVITSEWEESSEKEDPKEKYKDGMPKFLKEVRKNNEFEEGELSLESYCGFHYYFPDGGTPDEIAIFCDFIKEFFSMNFIEITVGNNEHYQAGLIIDVLAFHESRELDKICEIDGGNIVGTVHTVLNDADAENLLEEEDSKNE